MSAQELLARLVDEVPWPERVEPFAFLEDELLPLTLTPVEPAAFPPRVRPGRLGSARTQELSESYVKPATITPHPEVAP